MPILEPTGRSIKYCGRTIVVAQCRYPALVGRRRAVTISGVAGVSSCVRHRCPDIWRLAACGDDSGFSLRFLSGSAFIFCSLVVGSVCGRLLALPELLTGFSGYYGRYRVSRGLVEKSTSVGNNIVD